MRSLMMVTYDRLQLTKQTVDNIYSVTNNFNFIIVDNGSTDGTIEYLNELKEQHDNITLYFYKTNTGVATGRNRALKIAAELNTDYFVTIDNDVLLPEKWLEDCQDVIDMTGYGITGVNFEKQNFPLLTINAVQVQHKYEGNIGTACKMFSKKVFKTIGYFTTDYPKYGHEDASYSFRCRVAGYKIGYIKNNGIHLGEGENDRGAYRDFKNEFGKKNLKQFYSDCADYIKGKKSIYLPFSEKLND